MEINNVVLDPEMTALLDEFLEKIRGKSITEMVPILAEFQRRLPKDRVFTDEEKSLIIEETLSSMPDDEKNKYRTFLKMMKII
ncbi:MAG: hypothetical protein FWC76_08425 [Defluviitaleaceae bacterium]|nr:hypothetical protein [Defluviitaleaceae bacterium]